MFTVAGPADTVTIHYTARTRDGGVVEDTHGRKPLTLRLDDPAYLARLRQEIVGMYCGQEKTITLPAEQVFGHRQHRFQLNVPLSALPAGLQEGEQLAAEIEGELIDVWVVQCGPQDAILDANHPLAGESMEYSLQLISIEASPV